MPKAILTFDLGGTNLKFGLGTTKGHLHYHSQKHSQGKGTIEDILQVFKTAGEEAKLYAINNGFTIIAVGVGTPGAVDQKTGTIIGSSPNVPAIVGLPLREILKEEFQLTVALDNDANLATLGEAILGAGKGYPSVLGITLGTGIGGGFVLNEEIFHGKHGSAFEIGHTTIHYNGRICGCGKPGHLEAYASGNAIIKRVNELSGELSPSATLRFDKVKPVFSAAKNGYKPAQIAIQEAVDAFAWGLANFINTLDPACIVIGGGVMFGFLDYWEDLKVKVFQRVVDSLTERTPILPAKLGNKAGLVGAALSAKNLANP
jgi:glucokinase